MKGRKNKGPGWVGDAGTNQPWFIRATERRRRQNKIAKSSRKQNRRKK